MVKEFVNRGIIVNVVVFGFIEIDMIKDLKNFEEIIKFIFLGCYGKLEEVVGMIRFLVVDDAVSYIMV